MNYLGSNKDLVFFIENEDTNLSNAALSKALKSFGCYHRHWFFRYDLRKKELLYFFPLDHVNKLGDKKPDFIASVRNEWEKAGFEIREQLVMPPSEYFHVDVESLLFCIKRKH